ncbi:MAG: ATP-binding protein [Micrococcales bacterium]|nr:ATP-binding protein [Micrococcales bacterium]MCL2667454.1 ATP-binding protein [Micrococcales bacterium]
MSTLGEAGVGGSANQVVELLTAELVGQALLRSPEHVTVRASFDGQSARVEVVDDARDSSDPSPPVLAILDALAESWGVLDDPAVGHTVWVEVETGDDWWG